MVWRTLHTPYFQCEEVVWSLSSTMMTWRFVIPWVLIDANIRLVSKSIYIFLSDHNPKKREGILSAHPFVSVPSES